MSGNARDELVDHVRERCAALPEVTLRSDAVTDAFEVRRRIVAYLFTVADETGTSFDMLVVNADPDERHALLASGHPFFAPGSGRNRLGIVLDGSIDVDELAELVIESYRLVAPKKLAAQLDVTD